jgi:hypothetical protein
MQIGRRQASAGPRRRGIGGDVGGPGSHRQAVGGGRHRRQGRPDAPLDALEQVVARGVVGTVERLLEGEGVGRAVALEHQAAQAEQGGAVVAAVIDPVLQAIEHRQGGERRQFGQRVAGEFLLDEAGEHRRKSLGRLQRDIADEAVADDDVAAALEDVVAFDIAVEVDQPGRSRRAQQLAGLLDRIAALDRLFADVEQPTVGSFLPSTAPTRALPITANCSRFSALQSTLAPRSRTVV